MEIHHLEIFVALAETLNYSQTAQHMHISQPAVSQIIKNMENELGFQLFYRDRRQVVLTNNGKLFYQDVKRILNSYHKSIQRTRYAYTVQKSNLTLGLTETTWERDCLPKLIREFKQEYDQYKLFLDGFNHNRLKEMLMNNICDVIFTTIDDIENDANLQFQL